MRRNQPSTSAFWRYHTLHDVIVPAVGKLPVLPTHIQATEVDFVWLAVFELDELP